MLISFAIFLILVHCYIAKDIFSPLGFVLASIFFYYFFVPALALYTINDSEVVTNIQLGALLSIFGLVLGYGKTRVARYPVHYSSGISKISLISVLFLLLYQIINYKKLGLEIGDFRTYYELTRSDSFFYYIVSLLVCCIFITANSSMNGVYKFFVVLMCLVVMLLQGTKIGILTLVVVYVIFFSNTIYQKSLIIFSGMLFICIFFAITQNLDNVDDLLYTIKSYSDIIDNALLIGSDTGKSFGRLTFENEFYSRVPRFIFPEKPLDFGHLYLGAQYTPERFALGQGAPNFGIAEKFYDLGYFSYAYLLFVNILIGLYLKLLVNIYNKGNVGFIVAISPIIGVPFIPIGLSSLYPEHLLLAYIFNKVIKHEQN